MITRMKLSPKIFGIACLCLLALAGLLYVAWQIKPGPPEELENVSNPPQPTNPEVVLVEPDEPEKVERIRPRVDLGKIDTKPKAPAELPPSIRPKSVLVGEDGPLIAVARDVLLLPEGAERTAEWQKLLDQASFYEQVRMTEIPAEPTMDAGRKALRYAAVRQLGKTGNLGGLTKARLAFDGEKYSFVLMMAWEEWGKVNPAEALADWVTHKVSSGAVPNEGWWTGAITKGLAAAKPEAAAAAVATLSPSEMGRITDSLIKVFRSNANTAGLMQFHSLLMPQEESKITSTLKDFQKSTTAALAAMNGESAARWALELVKKQASEINEASLTQALQVWKSSDPIGAKQWATLIQDPILRLRAESVLQVP